MPLYPFRCNECGKEFDELFPITCDEMKPLCPKCGKANATRLLGIPLSWNPHPIVFQNSASRQMDVALAAERMVKNNDDKK